MRRILSFVPLSSTAIFGLVLNLMWYRDYFQASNYPGYFPIAMASFFIMSEFSLWAFSTGKNVIAVSLKYGLVTFSILATLSSQFSATSEAEKQNAVTVYEKKGIEDDVEYYREQISKQDEIIDRYVTARAENMLFSRTEDEFEEAKRLKSGYESKLENLRAENREAVQEVFTTKTVYSWFAYDLPKIFSNGFTEELVRVLFQLFSACLMAFMAPVSIITMRNMVVDHSSHQEPVEEQETAQIDNSKNIDNPDPAVTVRTEPTASMPEKEPVIDPVIDPVAEPIIESPIIEGPVKIEANPEPIEITKIGLKNIIIMYGFGWRKFNRWLFDNEIMERFEKKRREGVYMSYTIEQCKYVKNMIISAGLDYRKNSNDEIIERLKIDDIEE